MISLNQSKLCSEKITKWNLDKQLTNYSSLQTLELLDGNKELAIMVYEEHKNYIIVHAFLSNHFSIDEPFLRMGLFHISNKGVDSCYVNENCSNKEIFRTMGFKPYKHKDEVKLEGLIYSSIAMFFINNKPKCERED